MQADLDTERAALAHARRAAEAKLARFRRIESVGADALSEEYIDAVVRGAVEQLQHDLVTFGRIDEYGQPWRIGLYGVDDDAGDQVVVDWRARFATGFYQATLSDPRGLEGRVSYVGCIDDLLVEDFTSGEVHGSSPLLAELARSRGDTMRAAVATLQSHQDALVRLDPTESLVLRGGPGTGKTVVGLHRAAWLVYNDDRITADRILVVGPSERFLRFIATVLPTLGERKVHQTTFDRLLGPATELGGDPRWPAVLDRFERSMLAPAEVKVGRSRVRRHEVEAHVERLMSRNLSWKERRSLFVGTLARRGHVPVGQASKVLADIWPPCSSRQAWARLRRPGVVSELADDAELETVLRSSEGDGPLLDELRARFDGDVARYGHVIVDEAQDTSVLQLRAVMRRAAGGVTVVGDDAQRSNAVGVGLDTIAAHLGVEVAEMRVAYRMSAEIADWLNEHAARHGLDAVVLEGIRPTGIDVRTIDAPGAVGRRQVIDEVHADLARRRPNVATIGADVWDHKGVEYDGVVVDAAALSPREVYLAASRAAHELVVVT